jgi:hypothetical protein
MAGEERFTPTKETAGIDLIDRLSAPEIMDLRDVVPFNKLLDRAWKQLCIDYDTSSGFEPESSLELYSEVKEELKYHGWTIIEKVWSSMESLGKKFDSYDADQYRSADVFIGTVVRDPDVAVIGYDTYYDFKDNGRQSMEALVRRLEEKSKQPINDEGFNDDLITYLMFLDLSTRNRKFALKPITDEIDRVRLAGYRPERTEDFIGERLEIVMKKSEPYRYSANLMARKVQEKEENMFGENAEWQGELWRTVFYLGIPASERWEYMEMLLDGNYEAAIGAIEELAESDPQVFPSFVYDAIVVDRNWAGFKGIEEVGFVGNITTSLDEIRKRIGNFQFRQEEIVDEESEYLASIGGSNGIFVKELQAALAHQNEYERKMDRGTALAQATRAINGLGDAFLMSWQEELETFDFDDGSSEEFLSTDHLSQILSWKESPKTLRYGLGDETLLRMQDVIENEFIEPGRIPADQIRRDLQDAHYLYLEKRAEELGGGVFLKELLSAVGNYYLDELTKDRTGAKSMAGLIYSALKDRMSEDEIHDDPDIVYTWQDPETHNILILPDGIRNILMWEKMPYKARAQGISPKNVNVLQSVLLDLAIERGIVFPDELF